MRIFSKSSLRNCWNRHPLCEQALKSWYAEARKADWSSPAEVKLRFPSSEILGRNHIKFKIKGNDYRLIVKINYEFKAVYIKFVGTHAEYDKIDVNNLLK